MTDGLSTMYRIFGFNWSKLQEVASDACVALGAKSVNLKLENLKPDYGCKERVHCYLENVSTQGITIRQMVRSLAVLEVGYFCNKFDLEFVMSFIDCTKHLMPHSSIEFDVPDNLRQPGTYKMSLLDIFHYNCRKIGDFMLSETLPLKYFDGKTETISSDNLDLTLNIPGIKRPLSICPSRIKQKWKDRTPQEIGEALIEKLDKIQHLDNTILDAPMIKVQPKGKTEQQEARLLDNQSDYFVSSAPYLMLVCNHRIHIVNTMDFISQFENSDLVEFVDHAQFIIRKQSREQWLHVCESIKGADITDIDVPTIHIMKWNPADGLSVAKMQKMIRTTPKGACVQILFTAKKFDDVNDNDLVLFVRVGMGTTGLVGIGGLKIKPHIEDSDADMFLNLHKISDPAHPFLLTKELEDVMPTVNWGDTEESGEILAPEIATTFMTLLPNLLSNKSSKY